MHRVGFGLALRSNNLCFGVALDGYYLGFGRALRARRVCPPLRLTAQPLALGIGEDLDPPALRLCCLLDGGDQFLLSSLDLELLNLDLLLTLDLLNLDL